MIDDLQQLRCSFCEKEFKYKSDKIRHEQSHNPQFECKSCLKKFTFLSALHRHEKQHERKQPMECQICKKHFKDESLLKRHIQYAHKGSHKCIECAAVFNSKIALQNHSLTHKSGEERKYKCKYDSCTKSFNFSHHLKHHLLTHSKEKQYFCSECGKGFIQKHHFNDHLKTHRPEFHHICPVEDCQSKFATEASRKKHIKKYHSMSEHKEPSKKSVLNCNKEDLKETATNEKINSIKEVLNNNIVYKQNEIPLDDCKTAIGVCIITGDKEGNADCLCDQISCKPIDKVQNRLDNVEHRLETVDELAKNVVQIDLSNDIDSPTITCHNSKPEINISDGVIKLKDPVDRNIQKNEGNDFVPYNSCKDVLGNCIVSGDGTMGNGCFCAKINIDSNFVSDQEANEISVGKNWF